MKESRSASVTYIDCSPHVSSMALTVNSDASLLRDAGVGGKNVEVFPCKNATSSWPMRDVACFCTQKMANRRELTAHLLPFIPKSDTLDKKEGLVRGSVVGDHYHNSIHVMAETESSSPDMLAFMARKSRRKSALHPSDAG